jgi:hypothetical protein
MFSFYPLSMKTRSRSPKKHRDEKTFPIRVRVVVPELGYGKRYSEMHQWLDAHAGKTGYAWHSDTLPGLDATAIFFKDVGLAQLFVEAFGLELAHWALPGQ